MANGFCVLFDAPGRAFPARFDLGLVCQVALSQRDLTGAINIVGLNR